MDEHIFERNKCEELRTAKCQRQRMLSRNEGALLIEGKISGKRDKRFSFVDWKIF